MSKSKYECDSCGLCCSGSLIIEIYQLDVVREPKLLDVASLMDGNGKIVYEDESDKEYLLAASEPCDFLNDDKGCSIYPTRPNTCIAFEAGSYKCQALRKREGLELLADTEGKVPTEAELLEMETEDCLF